MKNHFPAGLVERWTDEGRRDEQQSQKRQELENFVVEALTAKSTAQRPHPNQPPSESTDAVDGK